ncbi:MAG: flagellar biosynthetic protein FliR [Acidobacteria bacterium]|nr:flagellar biosynthetic protein FliR [Acidobacteriota bacterium]
MQGVLENPQTWASTSAQATVWMLVLTRITGLLAAIPGLGNETFPLPTRAALAALLSFVLVPVIPRPGALPVSLPDLLGAMTLELAVGLLMGILVALVLAAVGFGASLIDVQTGFSFVQFLNPANPQPASVAGTMMGQLALVLIFVTGLHHQMILALAESYRLVPLGGPAHLRTLELVALTSGLLARGVQLAFPVLLALFLVDVLEGFSARFMPQLQLLQLSFPLKIAVGLVLVGIVLRELPGWIEPLYRQVPAWAARLLS